MLTSKYLSYQRLFSSMVLNGISFVTLKTTEILPPGYIDDFTGTVLALQLSNRSGYLGYSLTMNTGFRWERRAFEEATDESRLFFI